MVLALRVMCVKVHPFSGYGDIPFNLFTEANGDVLSRVKVRINEVFESMNIIDYMVDNLPSGEILKKVSIIRQDVLL